MSDEQTDKHDEPMIPKHRLDEKNTQIAQLRSEIDKYKQQVEQLQPQAEMFEQLSGKLAEYETEAQTARTQLEQYRTAASRGFTADSEVDFLVWQHQRSGAEEPFGEWLASAGESSTDPVLRALFAMKQQSSQPAASHDATSTDAPPTAGVARRPDANAGASDPPTPGPRYTAAQVSAIAKDTVRFREFIATDEGRSAFARIGLRLPDAPKA